MQETCAEPWRKDENSRKTTENYIGIETVATLSEAGIISYPAMPSKPGALPERRTGFADVSFTGRLEDENSSFYLCIKYPNRR